MDPNRITIGHMIDGARQAHGLTVIIDVFRAFSLECYLHAMGASQIRPVGSTQDALAYRDRLPGCVLFGERGGIRCEGFDFGNSPSSVKPEDIAGKVVIHTTSAGTQGIVNAVHADEIITGSFVNASAIAGYILSKDPEHVSLVCMGNEGKSIAQEDELCAQYLQALLTGQPFPELEEKLMQQKNLSGCKFFNPETQKDLPEADFWMCIKHNIFDFVLKIGKDETGYIAIPISRKIS